MTRVGLPKTILLIFLIGSGSASSAAARERAVVAAAPQYDTTQVYVAPEDVAKATGSSAKALTEPFSSNDRKAAPFQFPGGYVAEIHFIPN